MEKLTFEAQFLALYKYLAGCTPTELQQFELSRLSKASNIRKQLNDIAGELGRISAEALLARSVREARAGRAPVESTSFEYLLGEAAETGKQLNVTVAQLISVSAVACAAHLIRENHETLPYRTIPSVGEELRSHLIPDDDPIPEPNPKQLPAENAGKDAGVGIRRSSLLENWKRKSRELKTAPPKSRESKENLVAAADKAED